jgi:3'-phosphoadenosine 5'-phosphosulfate (PAPS) 3'-phosphatase
VINSTLSHFWPNLLLLGEENIETSPEHTRTDLSMSILPPDYIPEDVRTLRVQDLVVWIDPLDGTFHYVHGNYIAVTSLIGVAYQGNPIFGALSHPFAESAPTYFGGPGMPIHTFIGNTVTEVPICA